MTPVDATEISVKLTFEATQNGYPPDEGIMANYFARIELHKAEWPEDYKGLHKELRKIGFEPCVALAKGDRRLPKGFYSGKKMSDDARQVMKELKKAATSTEFKYEISLVEAASAVHHLNKKC